MTADTSGAQAFGASFGRPRVLFSGSQQLSSFGGAKMNFNHLEHAFTISQASTCPLAPFAESQANTLNTTRWSTFSLGREP